MLHERTRWAILLCTTVMGTRAALAACDASQFRQFDFWLGTWDVHTPDGKLAGRNTVTSEYDGCVVHEHYATGHAYAGESLNIYDASRQRWHQTWVDTEGMLLVLEGGLHEGAMVLEGIGPDANQHPVRNRITWTPNADGSVRQYWESADEAGHWKVVFDGRYTRVAPTTGSPPAVPDRVGPVALVNNADGAHSP